MKTLLFGFLIVGFALIGVKAEAKRPKLPCTNEMAREIQKSVASFARASEIHEKERTKSIRELESLHSSAQMLAIVCTLGFAISLGLLTALLTWKILQKYFNFSVNNKLAAIGVSIVVSHIYFFSALLLANHAYQENRSVLSKFRKELSVKTIPPLPEVSDSRALAQVPEFINGFHENLERLSVIYKQDVADLASQNRWWSFGWDDVATVEFEILITKALKDQFHLQKRGAKLILPDVSRFCYDAVTI